MPRTPTISLKKEEFEKLIQKAEDEGHPSIYAYLKALIKKELKNH